VEGEGWVDESMLLELAGRRRVRCQGVAVGRGGVRCLGEYWAERMWSDGR